MSNFKIFTGNSNPQLAKDIAKHLKMPLGKATVDKFSDGEIMVEINENVRGHDIYLVQSTSAPANDNLMELVIMADALHRASARSIIAVMPYFGYARQDRRVRSARVPITAKAVANTITTAKIASLITVDLHADQIQGFFDVPVDNIYGTAVMFDDIKSKSYKSIAVVSPDVGGVARARAVAKRLNNADLAIIDKRRPAYNEAEVMNIVGEVKGKNCVIVDDIVDTAGTLCRAAEALEAHGAKSVVAYCSHPILSGNAIENIAQSVLEEVIVTDTIPLHNSAKKCNKIRMLSLSSTIATTIYSVAHNKSLISMFAD